jgi:hypothetical protein
MTVGALAGSRDGRFAGLPSPRAGAGDRDSFDAALQFANRRMGKSIRADRANQRDVSRSVYREIAASGEVIKIVHEPFATACNLALIALSFIGIGLGALRVWRTFKHPDQLALSEKLERTGMELDNELGDILELVQSHVNRNQGYSDSLIQADRDLPISAKPEQVRMTVKFLIAENEKMRLDTNELRRNLEQSRTQI